MVVPLNNIEASQASLIFTDLMHQGIAAFRPIPGTKVAVLTDSASNMPRLLKVLEVLEKANIPPEIQVYPLKYATASELAPKLNSLLQAMSTTRKTPGGGGGAATLMVTEDTRTNAVIVLAEKADQVRAEALIRQLDKDLGA
ncbi:MAG: secretin N-terminal domain-containing protein, partial [Elusimicrobiota bacterium]